MLFPPKSLHPDTVRSDLFLRLCPTSDDAWLYWMGRRAGWSFKLARPAFKYRSWPGTQACGLRLKNAGPWGDNDRQIANLMRCMPLPDLAARKISLHRGRARLAAGLHRGSCR
jgi:hypothetical protein